MKRVFMFLMVVVLLASCKKGNLDVKTTFTVNGVSFNMVKVTGGTFQMGDNTGDDNEKPVHSVTLSDYYIGETEVTQALWVAVMGTNTSYFKGDNLPVENMSWEECQEFIGKLNSLTGKKFALPTEAQWEYAARGGSKSLGRKYSGSDTVYVVAWYFVNSNEKTHPVASKQANELGIYDMSGNVWEWCQDWYGDYSSTAQTNPAGPSNGVTRVIRGGSIGNQDLSSRVANRDGKNSGYRAADLGLRIALVE